MAYDLQAAIQRLRTATDDLTPTPATDAPFACDNDAEDYITLKVKAAPGKPGYAHGYAAYQASSKASDPDLRGLARGGDLDHATTPPISVPQSVSVEDTGLERHLVPSSRYQEPSPLEDFFRNRRPSISFDPKVTLDSGHQRGLEEALPKLAINTNPRGRSILHERSRRLVGSPLLRAHSEAELNNYDPVTGSLLSPSAREDHNDTGSQSPSSRSHYPLFPKIPTSAYSIPRARTTPGIEEGASLTSDSTASPAISEVQTPNDNMDILLSPITAFPPFAYPNSLEDSSAWPRPRRQTSTSRAKSYKCERMLSMREGLRQNSRSSRRSTSSSMSPANAFLSRFAREELPPEPDSEGQEVGEYVLGKQVGFGGFSTVKEAYTLEGDERICRAVKIVRKQLPGKEERENEQLQAEFEHEVGLWRCLAHRNILPLIEVYDTDFATFCFTKLNTGGTLFDLVRVNRQGINRDLTRRYAYQLASAIRYLHEDVRVVHRDIKLENCLIDFSDPSNAEDGGNLLLCDFGLAEFVTHDIGRNSPDPYDRASDRPPPRNIGPSETSTSIAGSLQYASPELIMSPAGFLSSVVDVWAFGVVIYALLVGDLPFQHMFQPRVQAMILAGHWNVEALEVAPGVVGYEEEVLELMGGCLEMQSESRWTIAKVIDCRWLLGCQEMLEENSEGWKL